jgi:hypothetical protein
MSKAIGLMATHYERGNFIFICGEIRWGGGGRFALSFSKLSHIKFLIDYAAFIDYFKNHDTDVALCDHFMEPCVDAATKLNIPYVITASMDLSKGKNFISKRSK